jgi:uncharacterized protein with GYD domain
MAVFLMFGDYSLEGMQGISAERTEKSEALVAEHGGEIKAGYALLGEHDLVLVAEFPGIAEAIKASVDLSRLLGISFTTAPAVTIEEFDALVG